MSDDKKVKKPHIIASELTEELLKKIEKEGNNYSQNTLEIFHITLINLIGTFIRHLIELEYTSEEIKKAVSSIFNNGVSLSMENYESNKKSSEPKH